MYKLLSASQLEALKTSGIPEHMHGAMVRYIEQGLPPGHFLTAVLENDLMKAVNYADAKNAKALPAYVRWLYNHAPHGCWGHKGAVSDWSQKVYDHYVKEQEEANANS